ncbi:response regulator [Halonotius terrestris]|uniref:Response regulator n=1 Tax=Halonotius terrestris TaxID=2487750 RepID=A0A8J8P8Q5_9EURY|nr:HalX domain-containing protein [Halonotius terrestris]TQQ81079.1 response regulator [Halonotius terrestris]
MSDDTILVVEDDPTVTHLYNQFLEPEYTVVTTTTAEAAIDVLRGEQAPEGEVLPDTIDAVLLDRRLPDEPGETVLNVIEEDELDCRVAMVTGVEPDFDIIDMGFDLYILKPVTRDELMEAVDTLFVRSEYGGLLREAASLASKRALLESQKSESELDASEEYRELLGRMEDLDDELLDLADTLSADDYRVMFRDIGGQ